MFGLNPSPLLLRHLIYWRLPLLSWDFPVLRNLVILAASSSCLLRGLGWLTSVILLPKLVIHNNIAHPILIPSSICFSFALLNFDVESKLQRLPKCLTMVYKSEEFLWMKWKWNLREPADDNPYLRGDTVS